MAKCECISKYKVKLDSLIHVTVFVQCLAIPICIQVSEMLIMQIFNQLKFGSNFMRV